MRGITLTVYLYEEEIKLLDTISSLNTHGASAKRMRSSTMGMALVALGSDSNILLFADTPAKKKRLREAVEECREIYAKHKVHRIGNNGAAKVSDKARKVRV